MKRALFLIVSIAVLTVISAIGFAACDNGTSPSNGVEVPDVSGIPDTTSVKFEGKTVWNQIGTGVGDTWRVLDFSWSDEYQN